MQNKTTVRYDRMPVGVTIIKKTSVGEDVEKKEHLGAVDVNVNWCSHYSKRHGVSSEKLKLELPYDPAILLLAV